MPIGSKPPVGHCSLHTKIKKLRSMRHDLMFNGSMFDKDWVGETLDCVFAKSATEKGVGMFPRQEVINISGNHWEVTFFSVEEPHPTQCTLAVKAVKPESSDVLLDMYDLMVTEAGGVRKFGFHNNFSHILDMWKAGMVFVLKVEDSKASDKLKKHHPFLNWSAGGHCLYLPVLAVLDEPGNCDILWVHKAMRRKGAARVIMDQTDMKTCGLVLESAVPFWDAMGISYTRVSKGM